MKSWKFEKATRTYSTKYVSYLPLEG